MKTLYGFLIAASLWAQPTISNIELKDLTESSVRVAATLSTPGYPQIRYGTASVAFASMPGQSISSYMSTNPATGLVPVSISIGGLQPDTFYYCIVGASDNSSMSPVNEASCNFTTGPAGATYAAPPASPVAFVPVRPDTTAYTVVRMAPKADLSQCEAKNAPGGNAGSVAIGDTLQQVVDKVGFGTVIEFDQSVDCKIIGTGSAKTGIVLPDKTPDVSVPHRYVVGRTKQLAVGDFPPEGVQTNSTWTSRYAKLTAQTPAARGSQGQSGQVLATAGNNSHHFWFENIEITSATVASVTDTDPEAYDALVDIHSRGSDHNPHHNFFDRVYLHSGGWPSRSNFLMWLGGSYNGLFDSKTFSDYWLAYQWTTAGASFGGGTITFPIQTFKLNAADAARGMTTTASISWTGGGTGSWTACLGDATATNQLRIVYVITSGTLTPVTTNLSATLKVGAPTCDNLSDWAWTGGNITAGVPDSYFLKDTWYTSTIYSVGGTFSFGIHVDDGGTGPSYVHNNWLETYGLNFYYDSGGSGTSSNDMHFTKNHMFWNQNHQWRNATSNGYFYPVRQHFETKRGLRWLLNGNIVEGGWGWQNEGPQIVIASHSTTSQYSENGSRDFTISSNTLRHGAVGFNCQGNPATTSLSGSITNRVYFQNNLIFDMNRFVYGAGGLSELVSPNVSAASGCQNFKMQGNSFGEAGGPSPAWLYLGTNNGLGWHWDFRDNVTYFSANSTNGLHTTYTYDGNDTGGPDRLPAIPEGGASIDSLNVAASQLTNSGTPAPAYNISNNIIIGGLVGSGPTGLTSITSGQVATEAGNFPTPNFWPNANTKALREAQAGLQADYTIDPAGTYGKSAYGGVPIGYNKEALLNAQGIARNFAAYTGDTFGVFKYKAPDTRACSVGIYNGTTPIAIATDTGGAVNRTLSIPSGLSISTAYTARLLCYFEQLASDPWITHWPSDQITTASITTQASVTLASTSLVLTIPSGGDASITVIRANGSAQSPVTCTVSPCSVSMYRGLPNQIRIQYHNASAVQTGDTGYYTMTP